MRWLVSIVLMLAVVVMFSGQSAQASQADAGRRLFAAVQANDLAAVRQIINEGADPFGFDGQGRAPVDIAVDHGFFEIAHFLLSVQNGEIARKTLRQPDIKSDRGAAVQSPLSRKDETVVAPAIQIAPQTILPDNRITDETRQPIPQDILPAVVGKGQNLRGPIGSSSDPDVGSPVVRPLIQSSQRVVPYTPNPLSRSPESLTLPARGVTDGEPKTPLPERLETVAGVTEPDGFDPIAELPFDSPPEAPSVFDRLVRIFESAGQRHDKDRISSGTGSQGIPDPSLRQQPPGKAKIAPPLVSVPTVVTAQVVTAPSSTITKGRPAAPAGATVPVTTATLQLGDMVFGREGRLGKKRKNTNDGTDSCVKKPSWRSTFCVEQITWPKEIDGDFGRPGFYAGGGRAIVRYDGGEASQYHVLFPASSFARIARYFKRKLGTPTDTPDIWTAMLGEPKRFNKTFRWRVPAAAGGGQATIELREMDDLRWSMPPDPGHGVLRLYRRGAGTVFELLTATDLLLMQVRKGYGKSTSNSTASRTAR